ncbi:maker683 [Drosophila busckii]|uniref:Maker683 n=1 Tax=Drosophila busckii TaxID=30019 RepID=A0A0M5J0X7_DROBS|nr:uncharacterized protein LOC108599252 [Drosophila busckii]ALC43698.1 maker683 [Drosophila busckii]
MSKLAVVIILFLSLSAYVANAQVGWDNGGDGMARPKFRAIIAMVFVNFLRGLVTQLQVFLTMTRACGSLLSLPFRVIMELTQNILTMSSRILGICPIGSDGGPAPASSCTTLVSNSMPMFVQLFSRGVKELFNPAPLGMSECERKSRQQITPIMQEANQFVNKS